MHQTICHSYYANHIMPSYVKQVSYIYDAQEQRNKMAFELIKLSKQLDGIPQVILVYEILLVRQIDDH